MLKDLDSGLEGRHVIIVEDIVDTGLTLTYLQDILRARAPRTLRTACFLSKPSRRVVDVTVEYIGFTIDDHFVVGYGLDYAEKYRNLRGHRGAGRAVTDEALRHHHRSGRAACSTSASTVELAAGGHVTPLARDTLAARRVTVVPAGTRRCDAACRPRAGGRHPPGGDRQRPLRRGAQARAGRAPARPRPGRRGPRHRHRPIRSTIRTSPRRWRARSRAARRTPAS